MRRLTLLLAAMVSLSACGGGDGTTQPVDGPGGLFAVEHGPADSAAPVVLFLHGASYTSAVWERTGIVDVLADAGVASVAVDLPGFGRSPASDLPPAELLAAVIDDVDEGHGVVVVSPSMSGSFSLPLVAAGPPPALVGSVPVAPVGIGAFVDEIVEPAAPPALVVWGTEDSVIDPGQATVLAEAFATGEVLLIDGAGHAAYEDQPDVFAAALVEFVLGLDPA